MIALWCALALTSPRDDLLQRLNQLSASEQFLFGQQSATLWGMSLDGALVETNDWFARTAAAGKWTSDVRAIAGADPAVLGIGLDMLAFDPPEWHRRDVVGEAIRRHLARGGVATLDWHAPSCTAIVTPMATLATVDGVPIVTTGGGTLFYAEDAPTTCLCAIVNDELLPNGVRGRAWLRAHAKHIANVLREQKLAGAPLIVRPFHEHNGDWFWWGEPFWHRCGGEAAYKKLFRDFVTTLKNEPGMGELLFAYSPAALVTREDRAQLSPAERRLQDPESLVRDLLRERNPSHEERRTRRDMYRLGYPGDDVVDVLGIDLYAPRSRPAAAVHRRFALDLRALREEAAARKKPHALTEVGTYRMHMATLHEGAVLARASDVAKAAERAPDKAKFFAALGVTGPTDLTMPKLTAEDWFNDELLPLAKEAKVAYAMVWHTYYTRAAVYPYYYVPYAGHPQAPSFRRFYDDDATLFAAEPKDAK